jgi:hypothetical protein
LKRYRYAQTRTDTHRHASRTDTHIRAQTHTDSHRHRTDTHRLVIYPPLSSHALKLSHFSSFCVCVVCSGSFEWQWKSDSGDDVFESYDSATNQQIESAFLKKLPKVPLTHGYFASHSTYVIDFARLVQSNLKTDCHRPIQRIDVASTGSFLF